MPETPLRFGIRDGDRRAATWRLFTHPAGRSELYLACRELGGELKASLHESGNWHIAYTRGFFEQSVQPTTGADKDRFVEKWPRPTQQGPGVTLAFRIITPSAAVKTPITANDAAVSWVPNASPSRATEIDIILTGASVRTTSWPGQRSMGTSLIGSLKLANGETAWVVHRVTDMPDLSRLGTVSGTFYKGKSRADIQRDGLRALVIGAEPDGSCVMYDCPVTAAAATSVTGTADETSQEPNVDRHE